MPESGNQSQFARKYGYSRAAVTQFKNNNKLVFLMPGILDFEASKKLIDETSDPARIDVRERHAANRGETLQMTGNGHNEFQKARAVKEKYLAMQAKMEYELAEGKLIIRDDVHKAAFEASRKLRDNLHSLCKQSAPNVIGIDSPEAIETYLRDEVDKMLEEFITNCVL